MEILPMPMWKSRILNAVAWLLGFRGEYAHVITISVNLYDPKQAKEFLDAQS